MVEAGEEVEHVCGGSGRVGTGVGEVDVWVGAVGHGVAVGAAGAVPADEAGVGGDVGACEHHLAADRSLEEQDTVDVCHTGTYRGGGGDMSQRDVVLDG